MILPNDLPQFLIKAKKAAYAGGGAHAAPSRPSSVDLPFQDGEYTYLDTYLGGFAFIGEEAVWLRGQPLWGMNYYGAMLVAEIPPGFGSFLKEALLRVPLEAPYRGPAFFQAEGFTFVCAWSGDLARFEGRETIYQNGAPIYSLDFHGGQIQA